MKFDLLPPRDQIVETMSRIYAFDMTTTSGGNISVRDENGDIWITPARVDKGRLTRNDIVRITPEGSFDGPHPPSSEYPFHLSVYKVRPDIRGIIHAHPGALVSFSICGQVPNTRLLPKAHSLCGDVAFARYALPGSRLLGEMIAEQFASPAQPGCVVLENHGVVVGASDLEKAFERFETLEFTAQAIVAASRLGAVRYLDEERILRACDPSHRHLPEDAPVEPTSTGKEARRQVCEFVHRACAHRLMMSTKGSFSARVREDSFVITPRNHDRQRLAVDDLVVVRNGRRPLGRHPSRAARLHRAIYRAHPDVGAIVNASPVHATAFSASDVRLDTRTIPESFLFLKDVRKIPFDDVYENVDEAAAQVSVAHPVALSENDGVLVVGRTVLDAFDRLEVLESTAAAIIRSRSLGPISPMSDAVIAELLEAFPQV